MAKAMNAIKNRRYKRKADIIKTLFVSCHNLYVLIPKMRPSEERERTENAADEILSIIEYMSTKQRRKTKVPF